MSDPPIHTPAPDAPPPHHRRPAVVWTFGACIAPSLTGGLLLMLADSTGSALVMPAFYLFVGSVVVWLLLFAGGVRTRRAGDAALGNGVMLGGLAGTVVGFALCSGVLSFIDRLISG